MTRRIKFANLACEKSLLTSADVKTGRMIPADREAAKKLKKLFGWWFVFWPIAKER